jgi:hypothetical protein
MRVSDFRFLSSPHKKTGSIATMKKTILLTALSSALVANAAVADTTAPMPYAPALPAHVQAPAFDVADMQARVAADMQEMQERMTAERARFHQGMAAPAAPEFTAMSDRDSIDARFDARLAEAEARFADMEKEMAASREDLLLDAPEMPELPEYARSPRSDELEQRFAEAQARFAEKRAAAEERFEQARAELEARIAERRGTI